MPNPKSSPEEKLRKLGERLRRAAARLHPVTEQQIQRARAAVSDKPKTEPEPENELDKDRDRGR